MYFLLGLALFLPSVVFADVVGPWGGNGLGSRRFGPLSEPFGDFDLIVNIVFTLLPLLLLIVFVLLLIFVFRRIDPSLKQSKTELPGFAQLWKETWSIFFSKFKILFGIAIFVALYWFLIAVLMLGGIVLWVYTGWPLWSYVTTVLCFMLIMGSAVSARWFGTLGVLFSVDADPRDVLHSYRDDAKKFLSLWFLFLSTGLILWGASVALSIPALILGVFFSLSMFAVIVDGEKGIAALYNSFQLVYGVWWKVFGRILLLSLCLAGLGISVGFLLGFLFAIPAIIGAKVTFDIALPALTTLVFVSLVIALIITFLVISFTTLFSYRLYIALKTSKTDLTFQKPSIPFRALCIVFAIASVIFLAGNTYPMWKFERYLERGSFFSQFSITDIAFWFEEFRKTLEGAKVQGDQRTQDSIESKYVVEEYKENEQSVLERTKIREADLKGYTGKAEDDFFTIYKSTERDFSFDLLMPRKWNSEDTVDAHVFKRLDSGVQFIVARALQDRDTADELAYSVLGALKASYPNDQKAIEAAEIRRAFVGFIQPASLFSVTLTSSGAHMRQDVYSIIVDGIPIFISAIAREEEYPFYQPIFEEMINTLSIQKRIASEEVGLDSSYKPSVINLYYLEEGGEEHPYYFADFWKEGKKKNEYMFGKRIVIDAQTGKTVSDEKILTEFFARDTDILDGVDPKTRLRVVKKNRPVSPSFGDGKIPSFSPDEILDLVQTIKESYGPTSAVSNPQLYYAENKIPYWYLDLYTTKKGTDLQQWRERFVFDTSTGTLLTEDKEYMKDTLSEMGALQGQVPDGIDPKTRLYIGD